MKKTTVFILLIMAVVLSSCASVYVATDYDQQADFSAYKSFAFFKNASFASSSRRKA